MSRGSGPQPFGHQGSFCGRQFFHGLGWWADGFRMIQAHYTYCAFYFYFYYISSPSDHEALDPQGWGPQR